MNRIALDTLGRFFEESPRILEGSGDIFFPRALPHSFLFQFKERLLVHQSCKVSNDTLSAQGFRVTQNPPSSARHALFVPTRQKKESLYWIAKSLEVLELGGTIVLSGEIQQGGKSYRKALSDLCGNSESWSKNHCVVAWAIKDEATLNKKLLAEYLAEGEPRQIQGTPFTTQVGIYGWDKIDEGSKLLGESLPPSLIGHGADFGAGYGYLSYQSLTKSKEISALALLESEENALQCARRNLKEFEPTTTLDYRWVNIPVESTIREFDWILMNPPHHDDQGLDIELGRSFVRAAAR